MIKLQNYHVNISFKWLTLLGWGSQHTRQFRIWLWFYHRQRGTPVCQYFSASRRHLMWQERVYIFDIVFDSSEQLFVIKVDICLLAIVFAPIVRCRTLPDIVNVQSVEYWHIRTDVQSEYQGICDDTNFLFASSPSSICSSFSELYTMLACLSDSMPDSCACVFLCVRLQTLNVHSTFSDADDRLNTWSAVSNSDGHRSAPVVDYKKHEWNDFPNSVKDPRP